MTKIKRFKPDYRTFLNRGADIIETHIAVSLGTVSAPKAKKLFFELR